ncbi:MAG: hypothetical protein ABI780_11410 [Ardenticatenales bacterium]
MSPLTVVVLAAAVLAPTHLAFAAYDAYLPVAYGPPPHAPSTSVPGAPTRTPWPTAVPTLAVDEMRYYTNPNKVDGLAVDERHDAVWTIGEGGLVRWSGASTHAPAPTVLNQNGRFFEADLSVADDGTVWVPDFTGVARLSPAGAWSWLSSPMRRQPQGYFEQDDFYRVAADHDGGVWFAHRDGALRLRAGRAWEPARFGDPAALFDVLDPVVAANGDVWFGLTYVSDKKDIPSGVVVRRADGRWEDFTERASAPPFGFLQDLAVGKDGTVWVIDMSNRFGEVARLRPNEAAFTLANLGDLSAAWGDAGVHGAGDGVAIAVDASGRPWLASDHVLFVPQDAGAQHWLAEPVEATIREFEILSDGSAWLATPQGLIRRSPDGRYTTLAAPGLPSNRAFAVAVGPDGVLVGTERGLVTIDPTGSITTTGHANGADAGINDVALAPDGSLWLTTGLGVGHRDGQGVWRWTLPEDGLIERFVGKLAIGNDGAVWCTSGDPRTKGQGIASTHGVNMRNRDGRWRAFTIDDGLPDLQATSIIARRDGSIWVGFDAASADAPLARDRTNLVLFAPPAKWLPLQVPAAVQTQAIRAMAEDGPGALWLLTTGGLARLSADGSWRTYVDEPAWRVRPDQAYEILETGLAVDDAGNVWASAGGHLMLIRPDGTRASVDGDLNGNDVTDVALGPDGRVWLSLFFGGVRSFRPSVSTNPSSIAHWAVAAPAPQVRAEDAPAPVSVRSDEQPASRVLLPYVARQHILPSHASAPQPTAVPRRDGGLPVRALGAVATANEAEGIAIDPTTGDVWVASAHGGVVRWSGAGVELGRFTVADGLPTNRTHGVAIGGDGTVWVATERGAARRAVDGTWATVRPPLEGGTSKLPAGTSFDEARDYLTGVAVDAQGGVWFGRPFGIVRLGPDERWETPDWSQPPRYDLKVAAIRPAPNGDVWIGTLYDGVHVRRADGRWEDWHQVGGFDRVTDVAFAPDGDVVVIHGSTDFDDRSGAFVPLSRLGADGVWRAQRIGPLDTSSGDGARRLAIDGRGRTWIAFADGHLAVPDPLVPDRWHVESAAEGLRIVYAEGLADLVVDDAGTPWIATDAGLHRRGVDGTYTRYLAAGLHGAAGEVVAAGRGGVWFGGVAVDGGVGHQAADGTWNSVAEAAGQSLVDVFDIAVAPDGAAWFGLSDGVVRRDGAGNWAAFGVLGDRSLGRVTNVVVAPDGAGWWLQPYVGYRNGGRSPGPCVCHAAARDGVATCDGASAGLPAAVPSALAVGTDGTVWVAFIGSDGGSGGVAEPAGLARRSPGGVWSRVELPESIGSGAVVGIAVEPAGALWLRLPTTVARRGPDGRWSTAADDASLALASSRVLTSPPQPDAPMTTGFGVTSAGQLWVGGGSAGVSVRLPDGTWRSLETVDGLPPSIVTNIDPADDGRVWLGTEYDGAWVVTPAL